MFITNQLSKFAEVDFLLFIIFLFHQKYGTPLERNLVIIYDFDTLLRFERLIRVLPEYFVKRNNASLFY